MSAVNPLDAAGLLTTLAASQIAPNTTLTSDGSALFEDTNYAILVTDRGQIDVLNKASGETYEIWSGMHFTQGDDQVFDFWGHTTFSFEGGTKAIIETIPWESAPGMTIASVVSIISGSYGVQIRGVEPVIEGDLSFRESFGPMLDAFTPDGNTIYENPYGPGFVQVDEQGNLRVVDQDSLSASDLRNIERLTPEVLKYLRLFSNLMGITLAGNFLSSIQVETAFEETEPAAEGTPIKLALGVPPPSVTQE
ncbi:MAG: DUF1521 domain-containing protein [Gammaproteobacteria bacterium]